MKKIILTLLISFLISGLAFAHPPQKINLDYNMETKALVIKVDHGSSNVKEHYINDLKVYLNDSKIITQKTNSQIKSNYQLVQYKIPNATSGDKIKVTAGCNKFGSKVKTITIK